MKYYSEERAGALRKRFESTVLAWPEVRSKRMFGCPSYVVRSSLFAVLVTDGVVLTHLSMDDREELARHLPSEPFKAGRRIVRTWILVRVDDVERLPRVMPFIRKSYEAGLATQ